MKTKTKVIELPLNTDPQTVEAKLSTFDYIHSYPLRYKTSDGYVDVIRYFLKEKVVKSEKSKK